MTFLTNLLFIYLLISGISFPVCLVLLISKKHKKTVRKEETSCN